MNEKESKLELLRIYKSKLSETGMIVHLFDDKINEDINLSDAWILKAIEDVESAIKKLEEAEALILNSLK